MKKYLEATSILDYTNPEVVPLLRYWKRAVKIIDMIEEN